jgi:hypothetical protein
MISIQANRFTGRRVSRAATGCRRALALFLCFFAWAPGVLTAAEDATRQQMQGLDEQVQEIKADVLGIAAELSLLEERLLYPSNTQVAVFVELKDPDFRLDAVQVRINGELVAHYIYSFKELEALRAGGVQRVYTGNIATGEHQLEVGVSGKLASGGDYSAAETFSFSKEVEPRLVGVTLANVGSGGSGVSVGNW